ncbi:MAG: Fe-S cluster assembly sulfur transfer protein SufU [Patescibacteria group bacterium]
MTDALYHELILDLNRHPLNKRELKDFDFRQREHNPLCGDAVEIFIKYSGNKITDISWQGEGCAISTASASMLTDYLKNKNKSEIKKINQSKVLDLLGLKEINPARLRCALLPLKCLCP